MALAEAISTEAFWQLEAAAMLSQIGYISLPVESVEKVHYRERLATEERVQADDAPRVAQKLLVAHSRSNGHPCSGVRQSVAHPCRNRLLNSRHQPLDEPSWRHCGAALRRFSSGDCPEGVFPPSIAALRDRAAPRSAGVSQIRLHAFVS